MEVNAKADVLSKQGNRVEASSDEILHIIERLVGYKPILVGDTWEAAIEFTRSRKNGMEILDKLQTLVTG